MDTQSVMEGDAGSGSAMTGPSRNSCLNAVIVALNETWDGKSWYTSTKELQLTSLEFCIACRTVQTIHLKVHAQIPRGLLVSVHALPQPERLCPTRVPRLRARRVTWNLPTAAELRIPIFAMTDLDCLEFGGIFEGSLEVVAWPRRLKAIEFHASSPFNKPIELVEWPACLQRLQFGCAFDQPINNVEFSASLQQLIFGSSFNQAIAGIILPSSLQQLDLGASFNQPVEDIAWPPSLQQLTFGDNFNQPIERAMLPASLKGIIFSVWSFFDQPIEQVAWPTSLQQLTFGRKFNRPIEQACFPASLQQLTFGREFDQPIEQACFPASLQQLTLGEKFDQPIEGVIWPHALRRLNFGWFFNQPVDKVRWPVSLDELTVGKVVKRGDEMTWVSSDFNQRIDRSAWPASLQQLTLGLAFKQSLQNLGNWMPNLEALRLLDDTLLRGIEWPEGLRELTLFGGSNLIGVDIPSTVQLYRRSNGGDRA